jgi:hypothetical protein
MTRNFGLQTIIHLIQVPVAVLLPILVQIKKRIILLF